MRSRAGGGDDQGLEHDGGTDDTADDAVPALAYPIVDTGQTAVYGSAPGQDGDHVGNPPAYTDHGDGTVTDEVTGLMWQQGFAPEKLTYSEALRYPDSVNAARLGGHDDWRLPSIKELYSLIDFRGTDPVPEQTGTAGLVPFLDTRLFDFAYGDVTAGERVIDSQWATTRLYVADAGMMFGVNFADGRIKGYGLVAPDPRQGEKTFYVQLCRGNIAGDAADFPSVGHGPQGDVQRVYNYVRLVRDAGAR